MKEPGIPITRGGAKVIGQWGGSPPGVERRARELDAVASRLAALEAAVADLAGWVVVRAEGHDPGNLGRDIDTFPAMWVQGKDGGLVAHLVDAQAGRTRPIPKSKETVGWSLVRANNLEAGHRLARAAVREVHAAAREVEAEAARKALAQAEARARAKAEAEASALAREANRRAWNRAHPELVREQALAEIEKVRALAQPRTTN